MNEPQQVEVPVRSDGTFKTFWYHDGHVHHRLPCGHVKAWNIYGCHHPAGEE